MIYGGEEDYYNEEEDTKQLSLVDKICGEKENGKSMKHYHLDLNTVILYNNTHIYMLDRQKMRYKVVYTTKEDPDVKQIGKFIKARSRTKNGIRYLDLFIHYFGEVISHYANLESYFSLRISYDPLQIDYYDFVNL